MLGRAFAQYAPVNRFPFAPPTPLGSVRAVSTRCGGHDRVERDPQVVCRLGVSDTGGKRRLSAREYDRLGAKWGDRLGRIHGGKANLDIFRPIGAVLSMYRTRFPGHKFVPDDARDKDPEPQRRARC